MAVVILCMGMIWNYRAELKRKPWKTAPRAAAGSFITDLGKDFKYYAKDSLKIWKFKLCPIENPKKFWKILENSRSIIWTPPTHKSDLPDFWYVKRYWYNISYCTKNQVGGLCVGADMAILPWNEPKYKMTISTSTHNSRTWFLVQ